MPQKNQNTALNSSEMEMLAESVQKETGCKE